MAKKGSKIRILEVAEELFSKNGFDGTSMDSIAKEANVNKALIYYYFDNKEDIIISIFKNVQEELIKHLSEEFEDNKPFDAREKIKKEIKYLKGRKKVINLLLMESFKENRANFLFKCAETVIENEIRLKNEDDFDREKLFINEFFTGFIPTLTFIAYEDKWCDYFNCSKDKALDYFLDAFMDSHF